MYTWVPTTFWTEGDTDSLCEDVDALENSGPSFIRELDFLVGTAGQ